MERGSIGRWLLIALAVFLFFQFAWPAFFGEGGGGLQPLTYQDATPAERTSGEATCSVEGTRFRAELSTRGASLRHLWIEGDKYTIDGPRGANRAPINLVTTTREERAPLRVSLRGPEGESQIAFDDVDWELESSDGKSCTFVHRDPTHLVRKVVAATSAPFELGVETTVKNVGAEPRKHRLTIEQTSWYTQKATEGSLGRVSEFQSEVVAAADGAIVRKGPGDFEPKDFEEGFTKEAWFAVPGRPSFVATSSVYFTKALVPVDSPTEPRAELLVEEVWRPAQFADRARDPEHGHTYRARLRYPSHELAPGAEAVYRQLAFAGPKERAVLASAAGGGDRLGPLLDLGYFGGIGKWLVKYLYVLHGVVGSWGVAICLLTVTVKIVLFPLTLPQIKSTAAMRRIKPEMDAVNEKYKDDAMQRGVAMQELFRKHGVQPFKGCLPLLLQMPVWFALYTSLQTAVELYHTPFLWFGDLSAPDKYFAIPLILGAAGYVQQKIMPPQGDPMQQKMMLYMMPAMFTVMMLFLPAGLGVYMLTNTILTIFQQIMVERYLQRSMAAGGAGPGGPGTPGGRKGPPADSRIQVKVKEAEPRGLPVLGKGNARVQQRG